MVKDRRRTQKRTFRVKLPLDFVIQNRSFIPAFQWQVIVVMHDPALITVLDRAVQKLIEIVSLMSILWKGGIGYGTDDKAQRNDSLETKTS
jgi:hypothetical protein